MGIYYITLASSFICSFLSKLSDRKKYRLMSLLWVILTAVILILFAGLRSGIGDTGMYKHAYELFVKNPAHIKESGDYGFALINLLLTKISSNPQTLVFVVAMITQVCIIFVFYEYRSAMELQILMYITSGYFTVTMNGMRQCLAASLIFLCTPLLINGDFKKYFVLILLISTIHQSALFMIPLFFIVRMKPWSLQFYVIILFAVLSVVFYDAISPYIFKVLESTQYGHYSQFQEGGSSFLRVIVNLVPLGFSFVKKDKLKEKWPESDILVNISLVNAVFVALGTANWIFNRISIYLQLYNFILLPFILEKVLKEKDKRFFYFMFIICYLLFFYSIQVVVLNLKYESIVNIKDIFYYTK